MSNETDDSDSATSLERELPGVADAGEHEAPERAAFVVAGIGASAGGLQAISQLLRALPPHAGVTYVVVSHLSADHPSQLAGILGRETPMTVLEATDRMPVQANCVYVIPPAVNMVISGGHLGGHLELAPRTELQGLHRPIDHFFRSLAEEQGFKSIGVLLSGTGNDGTLGLEEIKAAGGITFAQDDSAQQDGMPRSAIAAGCVDFVLPPEKIAEEITRIGSSPAATAAGVVPGEAQLAGVFERLRQASGVDFGNYKRNTVRRRLARRMVLNRVESLDAYLRVLDHDAGEIDALYQDILINVTSFFRDPGAYAALKTQVFPRLAEHHARHEPVRIWALGCSTGEEAYSLAMVWTEFAESSGCRIPLQVFATDLSAVGIDKARSGLYSKGIAQDVSPERLDRFFSDVDGSYRIRKPIRDMCIFARQDSLSDPPFSRIDLVTCRNMLIYLEPVLQRRLIPTLHYSLRDEGYLWLGSSETIGGYRELFDPVDAKNRIYRRKAAPAHIAPVRFVPRAPILNGALRPSASGARNASLADEQREADRLVAEKYAPPGALISRDLEILQFRGDLSAYLSPSPGRATLDLLKMLQDGLGAGVRSAVQKAKETGAPVRDVGVRAGSGDARREVSVHVIPLRRSAEGHLLVLFEEAAHAAESRARRAEEQVRAFDNISRSGSAETETARLEQELSATRDDLQSVIEQQEAANEELQSANEEVQSANEELQSIVEELETSKEEIQSTNEELATVNNELNERNGELAGSNNDLLNLLSSVQMAIVMLGSDLRIRRFTPAAERLLSLIPADVGRPLGDIKLGFGVEDLDARLAEVMDTMVPMELEVQDRRGHWFSMRIRPYRTTENKIEGALLMLVDIDSIKRNQETLLRQAELLEQAHEPIFVTDMSGHIAYWNRGAEETYGYSRAEAAGKMANELLKSSVSPKTMREALDRDGVWNGEIECKCADGQAIVVDSRVVRVAGGETSSRLLQTDRVITERKQREEMLRQRADELSAADRVKNEFLAVLSHELRNPLASLRSSIEVLNLQTAQSESVRNAVSVLGRQTDNMVAMVDDLLDISGLAHGKIRLRRAPVDLGPLIERCVETLRKTAGGERQIELILPPRLMQTLGDAVRLEQIFGNLLSNALKFTGAGDRIAVAAHVEPAGPEKDGGQEQLHISVRDSGIGICAEMLPKIFNSFTQAEHTSERQRSGLGVGLTLTRKLLELHGGSIVAHSDGAGRGTEMRVRLPLVPSAIQVLPKFRATPTVQPCIALRIMIVDDNDDARLPLKMLLESNGHEVCTVGDPNRALSEARGFAPDVALLDIGMPEIDGYEVARRLRDDATTSHVRLVALTGYGQQEDIVRAEKAGFDAHITKPVALERLETLLQKLCRRR